MRVGKKRAGAAAWALALLVSVLVTLVASSAAEATGPYALQLSLSPDRSSPVLLNGQTVSGNIYVFVSYGSRTNISNVSFSLDGAPYHSEGIYPYDFNGGSATAAAPYDTHALTNAGHTISATVTHNDGSAPGTLNATFTVNNGAATPSLSFNPTSLSFSATAGGGNPGTKSSTVSTSDSAAPTISITDDQPWLSESPTSGPGPSQSITFTATTGSLAAGTYTATVTASASGYTSGTLSVTFTVAPAGGGSGCTVGGKKISPLDCSQVPVSLPYSLDFSSAKAGTVLDKNGAGTGFTMIDPPTNGTGYIPANLTLTPGSPGTLAIRATKGIAYTTTNSQDNALGVGFNASSGAFRVSATIRTLPAASHANEQAGVWFGTNEDNYVKLVVSSPSNATTSDKIELLIESSSTASGGVSKLFAMSALDGHNINLQMVANSADRGFKAYYKIDGGTLTQIAGTTFAPASPSLFTASSTYAGIFATNRARAGTLAPLTYTFDDFSVQTESVPPPPPPGTDGTWTTKTAVPKALSGAGSVELNSKLYSVGGKIASGTGSARISTVYVYNPSTNSWTTGANLSYGATETPAVVALNGKLYSFGGTTSAGAVASAAVYDPVANTWTSLPSMVAGTTTYKRTAAVAEAINGKIYIAGGKNESGTPQSTLLVFDPVAKTYTKKTSMPQGRENPGAAVLNGLLYVFGGRQNSVQPSLQSVIKYDPATNAWTGAADMPTGRRAMVVSVVGGKALVMGGVGTIAGTVKVFNANEEYDPGANTWRALKPMTTARHSAAAGAISGTVYVAGGSPNTGTGFSAVNEAFSY
jgi:N-acetylneuraminic acid mutarotase